MTATQIFIVAIVAVAVLAAVGVFAVAGRRRRQEPTVGQLSGQTRRRDAAARKARAAAGQEPGEPGSAIDVIPDEPAPDPLLEKQTVSQEEYDVTRRQFLNRSLLGIFGIFLGQFVIASLAFMWPKLKGGFGTPVNAGNANDLRNQIVQADGSRVPLFVPAAQAWITTFDADEDGTPFAGKNVVAGGLMALWQRCVHLGCRVPECISSQGFECPCHGSKYNLHGEYVSGPAPRNMDRFVVELDGSDLIVNTGIVIQTARSVEKTIAYPQGPTCN